MSDLADVSFFTAEGGDLMPTVMALSSWGHGHVHGVAVSGALGREAERAVAALGRDELVPVRHSVDLFRPAKQLACRLTATVVRESSRLCLVDVLLEQDGVAVARSSTTFLRSGAPTEGEVWQPAERPQLPPSDVAPPTDEPRVPFMYSGEAWTQRFGDHQNPARKSSWNSAVRVVAGEPLTPFQAAASMADQASMVTNWGTNGVEYINADLTLVLARPPAGTEIGLQAIDRVEHDGIAVGTATVFDREGPLGSVVVTALSNLARAIDMTATEFDDDGTRRPVGGA